MQSNDCMDAPLGDTVGRAYLAAFGYHAEYTSIFDGDALSIPCFIGSQALSSLVTIEKEENKPFLYIHGCRVKKCTDNTQCPKLKKYLRYIRRAIRKKGDCLTYEEAETLLKKRFTELNQYPGKSEM